MNTAKFILAAVSLLLLSSNGIAQDNKLIMYSPLPTDLREMVDNSDLIVVGRVEKILDEFVFYGYDEEMAERNRRLEQNSPFKLRFDFIDYQVRVEEVIKDDANAPLLIAKNDGHDPFEFRTKMPEMTLNVDTVVLRKLSSDPENLGFDMLLFLTRNPDDKTYGVVTFMDEMHLADFTVSYYDKRVERLLPVKFAESLRVIEFTDKIQNEISGRFQTTVDQ